MSTAPEILNLTQSGRHTVIIGSTMVEAREVLDRVARRADLLDPEGYTLTHRDGTITHTASGGRIMIASTRILNRLRGMDLSLVVVASNEVLTTPGLLQEIRPTFGNRPPLIMVDTGRPRP